MSLRLSGLGNLAVTLLASSLLVFAAMNLLPGDPAATMLGTSATPEDIARLHHQLGLDQPFLSRYLHWLGALFRLDLGQSLTYGVPVKSLIAQRLQVTLPLALFALLQTLVIGVPLGTLAAGRHGTWFDTALMATAQLAKAIPDFWLGLLLVLWIALKLQWLPASGFPGWNAGFGPAFAALVLPATALALPQAAILARFVRSSVITAEQADFVRTARAKGLSRAAALWRHALPNGLVPLIALIGIQASYLITGAAVIENLFGLPGAGQLLLGAVQQRDFTVVQDLVVLAVAAVVLINAGAQMLMRTLDPRLAVTR